MGNGGYVAGVLAQHFSDSVTVRLHRPVPLERPLTLHNGDGWHLLEGEALIATARAEAFSLPLPQLPAFAEVATAVSGYADPSQHPFPHCFVCGPARQAHDGLCIFPAPVPGTDLVAAVWRPYADLADETGRVQTRYLWAALDCPGGIAAYADKPHPIVLGQITGQIYGQLRYDEPVIVIGWRVGVDGRKHMVGTALIAESGALIGKAQAIWLSLS
jgi:hypothetical protein